MPRMSQERITNQVLRATDHTTPTGKRPRVRPGIRWRDYISDLAWSRYDVEPAELFEIAVDHQVFRVILGLLPPVTLPKGRGLH